jgi:hypothetical protein
MVSVTVARTRVTRLPNDGIAFSTPKKGPFLFRKHEWNRWTVAVVDRAAAVRFVGLQSPSKQPSHPVNGSLQERLKNESAAAVHFPDEALQSGIPSSQWEFQEKLFPCEKTPVTSSSSHRGDVLEKNKCVMAGVKLDEGEGAQVKTHEQCNSAIFARKVPVTKICLSI